MVRGDEQEKDKDRGQREMNLIHSITVAGGNGIAARERETREKNMDVQSLN
jgi:hypothetical protein